MPKPTPALWTCLALTLSLGACALEAPDPAPGEDDFRSQDDPELFEPRCAQPEPDTPATLDELLEQTWPADTLPGWIPPELDAAAALAARDTTELDLYLALEQLEAERVGGACTAIAAPEDEIAAVVLDPERRFDDEYGYLSVVSNPVLCANIYAQILLLDELAAMVQRDISNCIWGGGCTQAQIDKLRDIRETIMRALSLYQAAFALAC